MVVSSGYQPFQVASGTVTSRIGGLVSAAWAGEGKATTPAATAATAAAKV